MAATYERAGGRAGFSGLEGVFAALCLVQCGEPLIAAIYQAQGADDVPGWTKALWLPVYAFLGCVAWRDRRDAFGALLRTPLLAALALLAVCSALWSIDAGASARRGVSLMLSMGLGFYLAWRCDWARMLSILALAFAILIAGSFATALIAPSVGVMRVEHPGAWMGLWTHKNTLGQIMALGAPICAGAAMLNPARRRIWICCALGAGALVLLSTSKTSLLAMALGLGVLAFGWAVRRGPIFALAAGFAAFAGFVVIGGAFWLAPDLIVGALGRDLTFTGRTDIWAALNDAFNARPWLGYGYAAFWLDDAGPAFWVREAVNWEVASAHSGWREIALGLGRAGAALMALQAGATFLRAARGLGDARQAAWPLAYFAAFFFIAMSESILLMADNLLWVIYTALAVRLALEGAAKETPA
ncbi:MAG: O-antigen ligase family protein [Hyphomonadaceae bacterium]